MSKQPISPVLAVGLGVAVIGAASAFAYVLGQNSGAMVTQNTAPTPAAAVMPTASATPSATPIAVNSILNPGWKTYVAAAEKFTVDYPSTWKPYVNSNTSGSSVSISFTSTKRLADTSMGSGGFQSFNDFSITSSKSAADLPGGLNPATLADWIAQNSVFKYSGTMLKVGGLNAYKGTYIQDGTLGYLMQGSEWIYEIEPYRTDKDGQQADGLQILNSLRFQ